MTGSSYFRCVCVVRMIGMRYDGEGSTEIVTFVDLAVLNLADLTAFGAAYVRCRQACTMRYVYVVVGAIVGWK